MRSTLITSSVVLLASVGSASATCTCLYKGGTVPEGATACISTVKGPSMARCVKVQNVTSWQVLDQACSVLESRLKASKKPKRG